MQRLHIPFAWSPLLWLPAKLAGLIVPSASYTLHADSAWYLIATSLQKSVIGLPFKTDPPISGYHVLWIGKSMVSAKLSKLEGIFP